MTIEHPRVIGADAGLLTGGATRLWLVGGGGAVVAAGVDVAELDAALLLAGEIDAIVLDIRMPPDHTDEGMRALESLRSRGSTLGVLLLSMYASPTLAIRAMNGGPGTGYLIKDRVTDGRSLATAVRTVARGGTVVDPEVVAQLVESRRADELVDGLSPREREVLSLMAEGRSNAGIAQMLYLSPKTVESHVAGIMAKLGIPTTPGEHRRVLAVLSLLRSTSA